MRHDLIVTSGQLAQTTTVYGCVPALPSVLVPLCRAVHVHYTYITHYTLPTLPFSSHCPMMSPVHQKNFHKK